MTLPLVKLSKALDALNSAANGTTGTLTRRSGDVHAKTKDAVRTMRDTFLATDFRSGDTKVAISRVYEFLLSLVSHSNEGLRSAALETFLSISRHLLILGQETRLLLILISELSKGGPARSIAALFSVLARTIHLAKPKRLPIFASYALSALESLVVRPEEAIHISLIANLPLLFKTIGPHIDKISFHKEKPEKRALSEKVLRTLFEKCFDIRGSANRSAVLTAVLLSTYSTRCHRKSLLFCGDILAVRDDQSGRIKLTGAINLLKGLWDITIKDDDVLKSTNIQQLSCLLLCCTHSSANDVVIASFEALTALCTVRNIPQDMMAFYPPDIVLPSSSSIDLTTPWSPVRDFQPMSLNNSPFSSRRGLSINSTTASEQSSPLSSALDLSGRISDIDSISINTMSSARQSVNGESIDGRYSPSSWCSDEDKPQGIIDPLLNADLYEEEKQKRDEDEPQSEGPTSTILAILPDFYEKDLRRSWIEFPEYTVALIASRFLLLPHGIGLRPDSEIRVSHKLLALNLLSACASHCTELMQMRIPGGSVHQHLYEVLRLVLHEDDKLAAAAISFAVGVEEAVEEGEEENRDWLAYVWERKWRVQNANIRRALLQSVIGRQRVLQRLRLEEDTIRTALRSTVIGYGLLKVTVAQFLCSIDWRMTGQSLVASLQLPVLDALLDLLKDKDPSVVAAAAEGLPRFVEQMDLNSQSYLFELRLPSTSICHALPEIPMVIGLSEFYSFRDYNPSPSIEKNLSFVLSRLFEQLSQYTDSSLHDASGFDSATGLLSALSSLISLFPPHSFHSALSSISRTPSPSSGFLALIADLSDSFLTTPASLSKAMRVQAAVFAGHCETQLMEAIDGNHTSAKRNTLPSLPDAVLTERILLLPIRVLNLYYCIVEERKAKLFGRQSLSMGDHNAREERPLEMTALYSRLPNTGITQSKLTQFVETPSLAVVGSLLKGTFKNFLNSLDSEWEDKLVELLSASCDLLSSILEMARLPLILPLLPELCKYIETLLHLSPLAVTRLATQLLKVIFGRNAANLNLGHLKSLTLPKPKLPEGPSNWIPFVSSIELLHFNNKLWNTESVLAQYTRNFGWIASPLSILPPSQPPSEVTAALKHFENYITFMLSLFGQSTELETRRMMLTLFTQLRVAGVEFDLADPRKMVTVAVEEQLGHLQFPQMLPEAFSFLIVLARGGSVKWTAIIQHAVAACRMASKEKCHAEVLDGLSVVLHEFFFVRNEVPAEIVHELFCESSFKVFISREPSKYLSLYKMWLVSSRKDPERWRDASHSLLRCLTPILKGDPPRILYSSWDGYSSFSSFICALSSLQPESLLPVDAFVALLRAVLDSERIGNAVEQKSSCSSDCNSLIIFAPLLSTIVSPLFDEDRFILRTEPHFSQDSDGSLTWLVTPLVRWLRSGCERLSGGNIEACAEEDQIVEDSVIFVLRTLANATGWTRLRKQTMDMMQESGAIASIRRLSSTHPRVAAECISLFSSIEHPFAAVTALEMTKAILFHSQNRALRSLAVQFFLRSFHYRVPTKEVEEGRIRLLLHREDEGNELQRELLAALMEDTRLAVTVSKIISQDVLDNFIKLQIELSSQYDENLHASLTCFVHLMSKRQRGHLQPSTLRNGNCLRPSLYSSSPIDIFLSTLEERRLSHRVFSQLIRLPSDDIIFVYQQVDVSRKSQLVHIITTAFTKKISMSSGDPALLLDTIAKTEAVLESLCFERDESVVFALLASSSQLARRNVCMTSLDEIIDEVEMIITEACTRIRHRRNTVETDAALTFFLQHPSTIANMSKSPLSSLPFIHSLLVELAQRIGKDKGLSIDWKREEGEDALTVTGVNVDSKEHVMLFDCFSATQFLVTALRDEWEKGEKYPLQDSIRSLLRAPLLNGFAISPKTAIDGGWKPVIELRPDGISVSLPPIHKLNDLVVLEDFTWRTIYLGWTKRQQFESIWVSLLGVLSSTPSGDEMTSDHATEAVQSSTLAVRRLCSFLLLTQLEPQPGNPVGGHFKVPLRDVSSEFTQSRQYITLSSLLSRISNDDEPSTILKRSLEWSANDAIQGRKEYHIDQHNIYGLWSQIGLTDTTNGHSTIRPSPSLFLQQLRIELDAASAVRSLYEIFSHWFGRGVHSIPVGLLSETVNAMLLLSDLFEDSASFSSLETDARMLAASCLTADHSDYGIVVACVCKSVAVCANEFERASEEQLKKLQILVTAGLEHKRSSARCATIRGALLLLQAFTADTIIDFIRTLVEWTFRELEKCASLSDPIYNACEHSSVEYRSLVWTLAFRLIEHPSKNSSKATLFQMARTVFSSAAPVPVWQMEVITLGMQQLLLHSQSFARECMQTAMGCISKFSAFPAKLPFALRLMATAVYREDRLAGEFKLSLPALVDLTRVCDPPEQKHLMTVLVELSLLYSDPMEVLVWVSSLALSPSGKAHPQPLAVVDAMRRMVIEMKDTEGVSSFRNELINTHKVLAADSLPLLVLLIAASSPQSNLYEVLRDSDLLFDDNEFCMDMYTHLTTANHI